MAVVLHCAPGEGFGAASEDPLKYESPSELVRRVIDAPPVPLVKISPDDRWLVITREQGAPRIAELTSPRVTLARRRVDPRTNASFSMYEGRGSGYTLVRVADGMQWELDVPTSRLSQPLWAPDSRHFLFTHTVSKGVELWVADVQAREARVLTEPVLNGAQSDNDSYPPYLWMPDGKRALCLFIPDGRGRPPERPAAALGPRIEETGGSEAPVPVYGGHLTDAYDDSLYDYYMTSQPVLIDIETGSHKRVGAPGIYDELKPSPDGRYLLAVRIVRPYSHLYTDDRFPREVDLLGADGRGVKTLVKLPGGDWGHTGLGWASPGPRRYAWDPGLPATLIYIEALDGGDPRRKEKHRDRLLMLPAPFSGPALELIRTEGRLPAYYPRVRYDRDYGNVAWMQDGRVWVEEYDFATNRKRVWLVNPKNPGTKRSLLFDWFHIQDAYHGPGTPLLKQGRGSWWTYRGAEEPVLRQDGPWVYLVGEGGSDEGDLPFLDRFNINTHVVERLFRASGASYEEATAVLHAPAPRILTRFETRTEPPNYYIRDLHGGHRFKLSRISSPAPELDGITIKKIDYTREDGVALHGDLYLPIGFRNGHPVPVVIWAYPLRYEDASSASEVRGSPYQYPWIDRPPFFIRIVRLLAAEGYAVFWDASMPVVGDTYANDTAVEQLVADARAAVNKLVEIGVADRGKIAIAGHSYGAVMVGTLLANCDFFTAGIAIDGAYNLTNVPLGFQDETRSLWEAPQTYLAMSALWHANNITAPLLLVHGDLDDNWVAQPAQSQAMYRALKGLGRPARLVILPHEGHVPEAEESILHVAWEMRAWLDRHTRTR